MAINKNIINQNAQYISASVKVKREYSGLNINQTHQTSGEMGKLIPILQREMMPGEKITLHQDIAIQTQPLVSNLLHEIKGEIMYYFVPNRLCHERWEEFITGGKDGETKEPNIYVSPQIAYNQYNDAYNFNSLKDTLWDYFGYPMPPTILNEAGMEDLLKKLMPNSYRHRGYNKIWNDCLRYPDIEEEIDLDNNEVITGYWGSDYFTRSRIYQQRGVAPMIPVSDTILTHEFGLKELVNDNYIDVNEITLNYADATSQSPIISKEKLKKDTTRDIWHSGLAENKSSFHTYIENHNLSGLSFSLNDFLTGLAILRYQVNNARLQPRYIDQLRARFGVYPEDARLQRPEYLGSGEFSLGLDTTTNTGSDQGNIMGQGWASQQGMNAEYEATEHGWLHAILIVRPATVYEGTMSKMDRRETRFDYPTPELYNIPDVPVLAENIAWGIFNEEDDTIEKKEKRMKTIFGYQDVYEENRTSVNIVSGLMRPSINQNLATYNLARYFTESPNLNAEFLKCNPPVDRIKVYPNQPFMTAIFVRSQIFTAIPLPMQSQPATVTTI